MTPLSQYISSGSGPSGGNMEGNEQGKSSEGPEEVVTSLTERRGLAKGIYLLPNLITTGALFSGFYAIIAATKGSLESAAIAVVIAGFLDSLDGRIARMTNTQSEFGVQYDSLSDLVAFGVAPAVIMYSWVLADLGKLGWMIAFLYMACTALRLARFNTAPDSKIFVGLASPAAAGLLATLVWTWVDNLDPSVGIQVSVGLAILVTVVALLMVSNIRYYSPKNINLKGSVPFFYMLAVVILFVVVAIYPPGVLLCIGLIYGASGPIQALVKRLAKRRELPSD
ncbi:MAG: CDP-diacylglycerol--serine O-phosphatidyltransferase [Proteobacteria bacterium]|jgi:CDP-diacylglycerol--serine O-phosphatidyltransferase|nr:CDP-diacylglycerol--serine O-phosphatidyltransferase [Pseudomonadota bacterium]